MDLYADTRNLVRLAPVSRWNRTETGMSGWMDLTAVLLDNFCAFFPISLWLHSAHANLSVILTRDETRPNGAVKRYLVSRVRFPLPHVTAVF